MKNVGKKTIIFIVFLIAIIIVYQVYRFNYSGKVEVTLVKAIKDPQKERSRIYPREKREYINSNERFNWYMEFLSLQQQDIYQIYQSLQLDKYDYIITCGHRIIDCCYSVDFTDHDGICECEDNRIPLDIRLSSDCTDSIYVYKLNAKKNKYRSPGP
jgi:hypothetical protein